MWRYKLCYVLLSMEYISRFNFAIHLRFHAKAQGGTTIFKFEAYHSSYLRFNLIRLIKSIGAIATLCHHSGSGTIAGRPLPLCHSGSGTPTLACSNISNNDRLPQMKSFSELVNLCLSNADNNNGNPDSGVNDTNIRIRGSL